MREPGIHRTPGNPYGDSMVSYMQSLNNSRMGATYGRGITPSTYGGISGLSSRYGSNVIRPNNNTGEFSNNGLNK